MLSLGYLQMKLALGPENMARTTLVTGAVFSR